MTVELRNLTKRFGDLIAVNGISLTIEDGEFLTLVGPSGCGKTTTLRCIAGLETPTEGEILFNGNDVTYSPPQDRNIAFVFQNYALYPHMTTYENMAFALEDAGYSDEDIDRTVRDTADMLGIGNHLDHKPSDLSGGQQQRVALGRSIVREPDVFLLDEPLSNLDAKLRVQMRAELQKIHNDLGKTMIYVTHDQEEAMTMSDRVAILNDGELQQISPAEEAYHRPVNKFVAGFIGSPSMNFFEVERENEILDTGSLIVERPDEVTNSVDTVGVRPEDLTINPSNPENSVTATVNVFEQIGSFNIVYLDIEGQNEETVVQVDPSTHVSPGDTVSVGIVQNRFHLFDSSGSAIYNPPLPREQTSGFSASEEQTAD